MTASAGYTELHRHLDVAAPLPTLLDLAQSVGIEGRSTSLTSFASKVLIRQPMSSLRDVLARFSIFQRVLDRPEHLERVAAEVVAQCHREGIRLVELRFSPSWVTELSELTWSEALDAFWNGMTAALSGLPGMRAALVCIASRDYGVDSAAKSAEFYLDNLDRFVGFDLAGNESEFPCRWFEGALEPVRRARSAAPDRVHVTIHAGEASGPESVWEAIELLGAQRIGHGIRALEDPALVARLAQDEICLEMCPTSNWITQVVPDLARHPLRAALEAGVPASINTDDPGIFGVTLQDEIEIARDVIGLSDAQIATSFEHAERATFVDRET